MIACIFCCNTNNCRTIKIKVLNPVGRGCPDFFMEWNVSPSHLVPENVLRCPNRDTGPGTPARWYSIPTYKMVFRPSVLWDVPLGLESLIQIRPIKWTACCNLSGLKHHLLVGTCNWLTPAETTQLYFLCMLAYIKLHLHMYISDNILE